MGRNGLVYIEPFPNTRRCSSDLIMTTAIASSNLGFKDTGWKGTRRHEIVLG